MAFRAGAFIGLLVTAVAASSLEAVFNTDYSQYSLVVDGNVWLESASLSLHANNQLYSLVKGNLQLQAVSHDKGVDATGDFNITTLEYNATDGVAFNCFVRQYVSHLVFGQHYPITLTGTSANDKDDVTAAFPAFSFAKAPVMEAAVGVLAFKVGCSL
jgi:hypothetical protein